MVGILIALRSSVARHQWQRGRHVPLLLAGLLGLTSALGTLSLGFVHHGRPDVGGDVLAVVFALWLGGQLAQAALAGGDATLRPEIFALLPLPRRRLAWSLLVVGMADPVLVIVLIAYAALVPLGARAGLAATVTGVAAAGLTTALTGVLAVVIGGSLGPGARRGRDIGTIVTALALSLLALSGTLLPAAIAALDGGRAHWLTVVVRALPSGWGPNAVDAARRGNYAFAIGWLAAVAGLSLLSALVWPGILQRRMSISPRSHNADNETPRRRRLPATPTGAVCAKELRLWIRDPIRLTFLLIAAVVGLGVALIPRLTENTGLLMPFAGPITVVIAGACACNLYGNDGTSLWLTVMAPHSARPDVRGRQAAWVIILVPFSLIETVVLTAYSREPDLWPWALALLIALVGGATGLIPLASLIAVQPLDEAGNPTPSWSIKVHIALWVTLATAAPTAAVLIAGAATHSDWLLWSAVPIAAATSWLLARQGQTRAARRLRGTQTSMLSLLARST